MREYGAFEQLTAQRTPFEFFVPWKALIIDTRQIKVIMRAGRPSGKIGVRFVERASSLCPRASPPMLTGRPEFISHLIYTH